MEQAKKSALGRHMALHGTVKQAKRKNMAPSMHDNYCTAVEKMAIASQAYDGKCIHVVVDEADKLVHR